MWREKYNVMGAAGETEAANLVSQAMVVGEKTAARGDGRSRAKRTRSSHKDVHK